MVDSSGHGTLSWSADDASCTAMLAAMLQVGCFWDVCSQMSDARHDQCLAMKVNWCC